MPQSSYTVLLHPMTWLKIERYAQDISNGRHLPGEYLASVLQSERRQELSANNLLSRLMNTRKPCIFAEGNVHGDGSDWNQIELSILGDISIAVPVRVYDNGLHDSPQVHITPFDATLVYVPGALLRNDTGNTPADWAEVVVSGKIDYLSYLNLYKRRLLPGLLHANAVLQSLGQQGFITVPGLGCGQFAGPFTGQLGEMLEKTLFDLLASCAESLPGIRAVYFDPYSACENARYEFGHLSYLVRPLQKGNADRPQLCRPTTYEDEPGEFSDCRLVSFVAWDHVSWPGNDFYLGARVTDDGVKAAATSSMFSMTGVEGSYSNATSSYEPPEGYGNWADVVIQNGLRIDCQSRTSVLSPPNSYSSAKARR